MDCLLHMVSRCSIVPAFAEAGDVVSFDPAAHHKPCRKARGEEEERLTKATIDHGGRKDQLLYVLALWHSWKGGCIKLQYIRMSTAVIFTA